MKASKKEFINRLKGTDGQRLLDMGLKLRQSLSKHRQTQEDIGMYLDEVHLILHKYHPGERFNVKCWAVNTYEDYAEQIDSNDR